jgi:putative transposase
MNQTLLLMQGVMPAAARPIPRLSIFTGTASLSVPASTVDLVKRVVKARLLPTEAESSALEATLTACNAAAAWLSLQVHSQRVGNKVDTQRLFYGELRQRFGLSAQLTIRVIGKVIDAYASRRTKINSGHFGPPGSERRNKVIATPIEFRRGAAQPFDARCLSWRVPDNAGEHNATVSIWTVKGRMRNVRVLAAPRDQASLKADRIGESDLVLLDGKWFLYATIDLAEVPPSSPENGFVGVDLGIVNIATTSDGDRMSAARLNRYRRRQVRLRKRLQAKNTRSARRLLRKRRRKERRFATDVNHRISKSIVAEAKRTGRGIAIENLGGIRERVRFRKPQRATVHSWAFDQLGRFLGYKARAAGVAFVHVSPAYTSQTCSACGFIDKKNRRSQSVFDCGRCSFVGHADHNAASNIASRGAVRWGEVMRPHAAPTLAAS